MAQNQNNFPTDPQPAAFRMRKGTSGITGVQCGGAQGHPAGGHRGGETQFKAEHRPMQARLLTYVIP